MERALADVASNGDNDILPFDIDSRFLGERSGEPAEKLFDLAQNLEKKTDRDVNTSLDSISIASERLLAPVGYSGFRIATKMHPYWNIYFNSIAIAIAQLHEPHRSNRAHSYRFPRKRAPYSTKHIRGEFFLMRSNKDWGQRMTRELLYKRTYRASMVMYIITDSKIF